MAASIDGIFERSLQEKILNSKVLVVGAGGIGCEILKNLVMSGFPDIEIIDLDTIDLSNLNRQFLFHREHVGKSKAEVARESALQFNPNVKIKAYHDSIMSTNYGVTYFKKFDIVLNALDNRAARNHVNRMCLNADVPLIESGTAGYNGQVELIKKGLTKCYECVQQSSEQKSFPGCTIRNTPSELIHCIVWAKHLFNQLFGETADDDDISPDMADPEAQGDGVNIDDIPETGNIIRVNTRQWAKEMKYDAGALFNKFFNDDIHYLLSMSNLWKTRKPPTPIKWDSVLLERDDNTVTKIHDFYVIWGLAECGAIFENSLKKLSNSVEDAPQNLLVWDKDDHPAMDFVAACANIRAYIFNIPRKSRFEIKSMAGNIVPAIATTNAMTAGLVILQAFKVLKGELEACKTVYLRLRTNARNQFIVPDKFLDPPNPNCYVCAADPAIHLNIDTKHMKIKDFRDEVLIKKLNMVNPDVMIDAKGVVVISSEEGETECNEEKLLSEMDIVDGVILKCDDFFQNYELSIIIVHKDVERDGPLFEVIANAQQIQPKAEVKEKEKPEERGAGDGQTNGTNGTTQVSSMAVDLNDDGPSTSKKARVSQVVDDDDDDDDLIIIEDTDVLADDVSNATDKLTVKSPVKLTHPATRATTLKRKTEPAVQEKNGANADDADDDDDDDDVMVISDDEDTGPSQCKRTRTAA